MVGAVALVVAGKSVAEPLRPDQVAFREIYRELVETNTTLSAGSCTLAAERMAAKLSAAGFPRNQVHLFATADHPKEGGLVAVYPGSSQTLRPILLLAHIDVVEAKREDWTRDPFKLIEENGYFFGRGTADDKSMAAVWVDTLIRFKQQNYRPRRTVKIALTCGEESAGAFNGAKWLAENRRDLIDAEFALNEGGGGTTNGKGKVVSQGVQVGEKTYVDFQLETRNEGGHSSTPVRDNAIYQLARALTRIDEHEFPLELNTTTRAFFAGVGASRDDEIGHAMVAIVANPDDRQAEAVLNSDRDIHSLLRTTCVATMLQAGHARNALPPRARANLNCRVLPNHGVEEVQAELTRVIADPASRLRQCRCAGRSPKRPRLIPKSSGQWRGWQNAIFPAYP